MGRNMENTNQSKVFDREILGFLENLGTSVPKSNPDVSILSSASKLNIDLRGLESLNGDSGYGEMSQAQGVTRQPLDNIHVQNFLEAADVHLKDIIDKVFKSSERSFVIIRDDKIEYANKTFLKIVGVAGEDDVHNKNLLKFVAKEDWNLLAENIGEMLTNNKKLLVRLRLPDGKTHRMSFEAIYLPDNQHFTFILVGDKLVTKSSLVSGLYDEITGLPNFYLLEDRVQMAVNAENYRDGNQEKNMIGLIGIGIDNLKVFKNLGIEDLILRKMAERLVLSLKKTYTVASGLKYQFWILMPRVADVQALGVEIENIKTALEKPVADNFTEHKLTFSLGVSVFPDPSPSAKKLVEQAILAVQKAQKDGGNAVVIYGA